MSIEFVMYIKGFCQTLQAMLMALLIADFLMMMHLKPDRKDKSSIKTMNFLIWAMAVMALIFLFLPSASFWHTLLERYE